MECGNGRLHAVHDLTNLMCAVIFGIDSSRCIDFGCRSGLYFISIMWLFGDIFCITEILLYFTYRGPNSFVQARFFFVGMGRGWKRVHR